MLLLSLSLIGVMGLMISYMEWDERHNWRDHRRMTRTEKATRKLVYNNPWLEQFFVAQGRI